MMYDIFDIGKESFNIVSEAGWRLKDLYPVLVSSKYYKLGLNTLTYEEIFIEAFRFAKKNEYLDKILSRIIRKNENGKELALRVFYAVFPEFRSLNDLYDYCYDLSCSDDLKNEAANFGMNVSMISYYADESKKKKKQRRLDNIKKQNELREKEPVYCRVVDFLLRTRDEEKIVKFMAEINEKIDFKKLYSIACVLYIDYDFSSINQTLRNRLGIYRSYLAKTNYIKRSFGVIEKYIDSSLNIQDFCIQEKIPAGTFKYLIGCVHHYNPSLYHRYKLKKLHVNEADSVMKKIVKYINEGIDNKEFTIVDYFKMTNRSVNSFFMMIKPYLQDNEYDAVLKFYTRYRNIVECSVNDVLKEKIEINCLLDENGMPIANTGYIVTDEDKRKILSQIQNDGLPIYQPIYKYYLDEYFNKKKENVLKKTR